MSRRTRFAAALAVVTLASGCGDKAADTKGNDPTATDETVEIVATWTGVEQQNFQAVLDAFTAKTGIKTKYTSGGDDVGTLINTRLSGGAPPDVAMIAQPGVVAEFVKKGALKPLSGAAADAVNANYSEAWKQLGTVDGKLYGVYFKAANKSLVWYRTESFTKANLTVPKTWEEFLAANTALASTGLAPMAICGADAWTLTDWFENIYLRVGGPDNYDKLAKHQIPWTDPTVVQSLKILGDYWKTPGFVQGGPSGALQEKFTQCVGDVFGDKPKSAMLMEGDFVGAEITKLGKLKVGDTAKFFDFPSINGSKSAVVTAGDQAVAFKDSKAATALVAYLASPEAAKIMAAKGGYLSANKSLDPSAYPDGTTRALAAAVVSANLLKFDMSDLAPQSFGGGTDADEWKLLQSFLSNPSMDPAALAQKLEDAAKKAYK